MAPALRTPGPLQGIGGRTRVRTLDPPITPSPRLLLPCGVRRCCQFSHAKRQRSPDPLKRADALAAGVRHGAVALDIADDLPVIVAVIFDDSQVDLQAARDADYIYADLSNHC